MLLVLIRALMLLLILVPILVLVLVLVVDIVRISASYISVFRVRGGGREREPFAMMKTNMKTSMGANRIIESAVFKVEQKKRGRTNYTDSPVFLSDKMK